MKMNMIVILMLSFIVSLSGVSLAQKHADHMEHKDHKIMKKEDMGKHKGHDKHEFKEVNNTVCPISGEKIGSMGAGYQVKYKGKIFNLCCMGCEEEFMSDPEAYSAKAQAQVKEAMEEDEIKHDMKK